MMNRLATLAERRDTYGSPANNENAGAARRPQPQAPKQTPASPATAENPILRRIAEGAGRPATRVRAEPVPSPLPPVMPEQAQPEPQPQPQPQPVQPTAEVAAQPAESVKAKVAPQPPVRVIQEQPAAESATDNSGQTPNAAAPKSGATKSTVPSDKIARAIAEGLMVLPPDNGVPPVLRRRGETSNELAPLPEIPGNKVESEAMAADIQPIFTSVESVAPAPALVAIVNDEIAEETHTPSRDDVELDLPTAPDAKVTPHPAAFRSLATPLPLHKEAAPVRKKSAGINPNPPAEVKEPAPAVAVLGKAQTENADIQDEPKRPAAVPPPLRAVKDEIPAAPGFQEELAAAPPVALEPIAQAAVQEAPVAAPPPVRENVSPARNAPVEEPNFQQAVPQQELHAAMARNTQMNMNAAQAYDVAPQQQSPYGQANPQAQQYNGYQQPHMQPQMQPQPQGYYQNGLYPQPQPAAYAPAPVQQQQIPAWAPQQQYAPQYQGTGWPAPAPGYPSMPPAAMQGYPQPGWPMPSPQQPYGQHYCPPQQYQQPASPPPAPAAEPEKAVSTEVAEAAQLMSSLLQYLPPNGQFWSVSERENWLDAASTLFDLAYGDLGHSDRRIQDRDIQEHLSQARQPAQRHRAR